MPKQNLANKIPPVHKKQHLKKKQKNSIQKFRVLQKFYTVFIRGKAQQAVDCVWTKKTELHNEASLEAEVT